MGGCMFLEVRDFDFKIFKAKKRKDAGDVCNTGCEGDFSKAKLGRGDNQNWSYWNRVRAHFVVRGEYAAFGGVIGSRFDVSVRRLLERFPRVKTVVMLRG